MIDLKDEDELDLQSKNINNHIESNNETKKKLYPNYDINIMLRSCEKEIIKPVQGIIKGEIPPWINGSLLR
jgi:hypothetical protein